MKPNLYKRENKFPEIIISYNGVLDVIQQAALEGKVGFDCEFLDTGPTIIGVASKHKAAAWWWDSDLAQALLDCNKPLVAYSGIGADKPVIEKALGITTPLDLWFDPMLKFFILNPDLSSIPKTQGGEDTQDLTMGFMSLWACTSFLHDLPQWKMCLGEEYCLREQRPCPDHNELAYCAVDAWAGLIDDDALDILLEDAKIPRAYYERRRQLTEYCLKMQAKGIKVDTDLVERLETSMQTKKATLFPCNYVWEGKVSKTGKPGKKLKKPKKVWVGPFNPNSPKAVGEYFDSHNIHLRDRQGKASAGKQIVLKALEKELKPYGLTFDVKNNCLQGDFDDELPEHVNLLLKLAEKQNSGKGLKPWFDGTYLKNGRVHPRFNTCATSMGRLSSSKPNFTNVAKQGWGGEVRKCSVPEIDCDVIGADFNSLELNIGLWLARSKQNGEGIFELIINNSDGQLEEAAKLRSIKVRDVVKTIAYGSLYGEGLVLLKPEELNSGTRYQERKAKALLVYDGQDEPLWMFRGRYVSFTGANLSERLFKDRTREHRAKALKLQKFYYSLLPELRDVFQRETLIEAETKKGAHYEVRLPNGHRLPLYGRTPEDDCKQALALKGQGGGACYSQENMLTFGKDNEIMNLQVHDEYVWFDKPSAWADEEVLNFMKPMVKPSELLIRGNENGFTCPAKVYRGPSWGEKREIGKLKWSYETNETVIY